MMSFLPICFAAAIELVGVTANDLRAVAMFDSNNARVGDPLTLTVDFLGDADLAALHPPALSREVDPKSWKVDDRSAKTATGRGIRRLVYRVRPLREGMLSFPSLEFTCVKPDGSPVVAKTTELPAHIRAGLQVALEGVEDEGLAMPMPDGLVFTPSVELTEDETFAWRKACREAKAAGFSAFDFPEARLNEAACHIVEGNWAKALGIYNRLEWTTGQTAAIERGIVAALARKSDNPAAELPVWRSVGRPVLRHPWHSRIGIVLGALLAVSLVFCGFGRLIRRLAAIALCLSLPFAATADDGVVARLLLPERELKVGEEFEFSVSVECSRECSLENLGFRVVNDYGFRVVRQPWMLADGDSKNPSNVIKRIGFAARYDVPVEGMLQLVVNGMRSIRRQTRSAFGISSFTSSSSFQTLTQPVRVKVNPLDDANRPPDFRGIVGKSFEYRRSAVRLVHTNDVVALTETLQFIGFVPEGVFPDELQRTDRIVTWRSYFVADGVEAIPARTIPYYDVVKKEYREVRTPAIRLQYLADSDEGEGERQVAIDSGSAQKNAIRLRFAPDSAAPTVALSTVPLDRMRELERHGEWRRLDDGSHVGWYR